MMMDLIHKSQKLDIEVMRNLIFSYQMFSTIEKLFLLCAGIYLKKWSYSFLMHKQGLPDQYF